MAPMNGPIGWRDAAHDRDDQDVDGRAGGDRSGRDLAVQPDEQHAPDRRDQGREGVSRDPMGGDVEAQRHHAARIVPDALQGQPERRARQVQDGQELAVPKNSVT